MDNGGAGGSGSGGKVGSGGATSSGGSGSGGTGSGGISSGSGGATTGSGGATTATGGKTTSSGGSTTASGGTTTGTGGSTTGAGGSAAGAGGRDGSVGPGAGGSTGTAIDGGSAGNAGGYPVGNPAVASTGCGKALSTFKSGTNTTYKITSATLSREYIVYIPSNYDPSKPYRLVFGMHCMGSSATQCANNDKFYRLQPLDTGNIFVAPQGYTDGSPWRGGDNKDQVFVEDMVKLFESELCIDTSRVFSVGFSFGAMFTNAFAQTHQDTFRGVVVYATADYNIYFPTNNGKPLAYFGVHGTADGTCPFTSGKASKDRFVKNNGCTVPASVPEATSSTHVCYDYQCPSNYPVKWCTHNGGHTDLPMEPGQSKSWDIDLTWKFLTQF
jgi:poly(3-hydroxybutyrate) depolymerase